MDGDGRVAKYFGPFSSVVSQFFSFNILGDYSSSMFGNRDSVMLNVAALSSNSKLEMAEVMKISSYLYYYYVVDNQSHKKRHQMLFSTIIQ